MAFIQNFIDAVFQLSAFDVSIEGLMIFGLGAGLLAWGADKLGVLDRLQELKNSKK